MGLLAVSHRRCIGESTVYDQFGLSRAGHEAHLESCHNCTICSCYRLATVHCHETVSPHTTVSPLPLMYGSIATCVTTHDCRTNRLRDVSLSLARRDLSFWQCHDKRSWPIASACLGSWLDTCLFGRFDVGPQIRYASDDQQRLCCRVTRRTPMTGPASLGVLRCSPGI
jgi:hypothetical protein